ncbi:hypothetical protein [Actinoplanes sp. NPDC051851]|uniref:hypothetical protein n=1 Tax=Actinoplanes sp. NPDC051851 TaxID=3154753 RepID=UPI00341337BB
MRFISNEAPDNVDDRDDRPGTVQSEPVAVPQQRAGSPWHDGPADEPAPFGATAPAPRNDEDTEGDTEEIRTSAENRDDLAWTPAARRDDDTSPLDDPDPRDDADQDETAQDDTERHEAGLYHADEDRRDEDVDVPLEDRTADDDKDDVAVVDAKTEDEDAAERAEAERAEADAEADAAESDEVAAVDETPAETDEDAAEEATEAGGLDAAAEPAPAEPVVAAVAVPAAGAAAPAGPAAFFPVEDTQPLRDRWRETQLKFVDDPKASAAEAAALVDETIEKLTTAIRQQRGALTSGGDDTEALRQELRGYRDILDRLLGL